MPLLKPTFQPFYPDPNAPNRKNCGRQYCYPVDSGDIVRQQYIQTPCDGNLVEDSTFDDNSFGSELITNGTFTGSAASWTLGGNWAYNSNNIVHTPNGAPAFDEAVQTIGISANTMYRVLTTISSMSQGYLNILLGSGAIKAQYSEIGTYSDIIRSSSTNTDFAVESSQLFDGVVDDISVKAITNGSWEDSGVWAFSGGYACKSTSGSGGALYNTVSDYILDGGYYQVSFTVSNYGGTGNVAVYVDDGTGSTATNAQAAVTANGTYTYYIDAIQDGVIGFAPSTTFTGCISAPSVKRLNKNFEFHLIDPDGNNIDVSEFATYTEDKVLLNLDFGDLLESGVIEDYGCFQIEVTDSCLVSGDNLVVDGDFANGDYSAWIRNNGSYQYDMQSGYLEFIYEPLEGANLLTNGNFASGTTGWTGFGTDWTESGNATHVVGNTTVLSHAVTITVPPPLPIIRKYYVQFTISGRTAGSITVQLSDGTPRTFSTNEVITVEMVNITAGGSVNITFTPTSNFDGTIDNIAVHESDRIWSSYATVQNLINPLIVAANYEAEVEITQITGTGNIGAAAYIVGQITPITYEYTLGTHQYSIPNYVPGGQRMAIIGRFELNGNTYPGRIRVDNASLVSVEPFEATYTSECLDFQESHPGSVLVTAWCDQNAWGLDFENTDYLLQMRLNCRSYNPFFEDESIVSVSGTGDSRVSYGQLEKFWQFGTDLISESAHTTLAAMVRSDHFTVGEAGEEATEYTAQVSRQSPEWRDQGDSDLAYAIINLRLKEGGMKFNRHT